MINLRTIKESDNIALAKILRDALDEFNIPKKGTVYTDPTTDNLHQLFKAPGSTYYVVEENGRILGGCGIFPTEGLPAGYAELVKLYLAKESRGMGIGKILIEKCSETAKELGYTHLYLESFPAFESAIRLYEKYGFSRLTTSLGNSGHYACNIWMQKDLTK